MLLPLSTGSLFSGIGGLELGLEWSGLSSVAWQVEIDPFCRKVLAKHWPTVPRYDDIRTLEAPSYVDILAGGFPCQDVSVAGKNKGLVGSRSGLWYEFLRVINCVRPKIIIIENVPGLRTNGLYDVLKGLTDSGYNAEWTYLSAAEVGAPHLRKRIFIFATDTYSGCFSFESGRFPGEVREIALQLVRISQNGESPQAPWRKGRDWLPPVSPICRVVNGLSYRLHRDRLKALGNSVSPVASFVIGLAISRVLGLEAGK